MLNIQMLQILVLTSVFSSFACATIEDEFDEAIYDFTMDFLLPRYSNNSVKAGCVLQQLKVNKSIESFYTTQLLFEQDKLERELAPYLPAAEAFCSEQRRSLDDSTDDLEDSSASGKSPSDATLRILAVLLLGFFNSVGYQMTM